MQPAYFTIVAAVLAVIAAVIGMTGAVDDSDAGLLMGLAIVSAVIGTRE